MPLTDQAGMGFDLSVDGGTVVTGCAAAFNELSITGFNSLTITSHDDDEYSDTVTITIDVEVTFTPSVPPACTSLTTPTNGQTEVSSSVISWTEATGGATGYRLTVGTTPGGTNVLNLFDVGNVLTYDLGALSAGVTYYVKVTPYNISETQLDAAKVHLLHAERLQFRLLLKLLMLIYRIAGLKATVRCVRRTC